MSYVGGYPPSIKVETRPEHIGVEDAKKAAKEEGVNTFKPFENEEEYEGGNVRALFIGINYVGQSAELSGCVNDVHQTLATMEEIDFPIKEAAILVDDPTFPNVSDTPTVANMKKYLGWLIDDAKAGDVLYLHYSGHGGRLPSQNDKDEGYDSCLIPADYTVNGTILDDDLFEILAKPLPAGVRMTVCFDCCHSASMLDLPYSFVADDNVPDDHDENEHYSMKQIRQDNFSNGDVMLISGCTDEGTSADVSNTATFGSSDIQGAGGAATQAWTYMLENQHGAKYIDAIIETRKVLVDKGFTQVPQLSSSKPIDLDDPFSLFGLFTVDQVMEDTLPPEVAQQAKPEIKGIPKRFRHNKMQDYDPSALVDGFIPPSRRGGRGGRGGSHWMNNDWSQHHEDPRHQMRMGYVNKFGPRGRHGRGGRGGPGGRGGRGEEEEQQQQRPQRGGMASREVGNEGRGRGGWSQCPPTRDARQPERRPHDFREGGQVGGRGGGRGRGEGRF